MEDKIRVLKFLADKQQKTIDDLQARNDRLSKENKKLLLAQQAATDEIARLCEEVAQNAENFAALCRDAGDTGKVESITIQNPSKHVVVDIRHGIVNEPCNLLADKSKPTRHEYSEKTRETAQYKHTEPTSERSNGNYLSQRRHVKLKERHRTDSALENVDRAMHSPAVIVETRSHSIVSKSYSPRSSDLRPQRAIIENQTCTNQEPHREHGSSSINGAPHGTRAVGTKVFTSSSCKTTGQPKTVQTLFDTSRMAARVAWRMLSKPMSRS
jgi:hypothetical protein